MTENRTNKRPADGIVSGYVLKIIRESLGLSQERLAEMLRVERNTLQGWESGRRPLTNVQVGALLRLQARLRTLGADPLFVDSLHPATEADQLLTDLLSDEALELPVNEHPLSALVLRRSTYDLLAWPIRSQAPPKLATAAADHARHGPVPTSPELSPADRARFFERARALVDHSLTGTTRYGAPAVLFRRQLYYCLASADGLDEGLERVAGAEERGLGDRATWSPSWAALRSLRVSRARLGDPEPLRHFIRTSLESEECEIANLTYWAYWVGEISDARHGDDFMIHEPTTSAWRGDTVLRHLLAGMKVAEPVLDLDLYIHSIWSLLRRRARVVRDDPELAAALLQRVDELLSSPSALSPQARAELAQIRYITEAVQP